MPESPHPSQEKAAGGAVQEGLGADSCLSGSAVLSAVSVWSHWKKRIGQCDLDSYSGPCRDSKDPKGAPPEGTSSSCPARGSPTSPGPFPLCPSCLVRYGGSWCLALLGRAGVRAWVLAPLAAELHTGPRCGAGTGTAPASGSCRPCPAAVGTRCPGCPLPRVPAAAGSRSWWR